MSIFLMILLSVVIVVAGLILFIYLWLRTKLRKAVGSYRSISPFLLQQAARLKLRIEALPPPDQVDEESALHIAAMRTMWAQLAAKGVQQMATLGSDDDRMIIAGRHPATNVIALVVRAAGMPPFFEFITLSASNTARVLTGEPLAPALQLPSLSVEAMPGSTVDGALAALASQAPGRALDTRMLILLIERLHATRMDSQLTRAPTVEDMKAQAAASGIAYTLDAALERQAHDMNRAAWLDAVRISLLDHARRKLKLDEEPWGRLDEDLIVVHNALHADEVISTLAGYNLVEQLGEQLKRQNFSPAQIFDEINRRLDPEDRRQLVLNLGVPIQARVFARSRALEAAGVELNMVVA